MHHLCSSDLYLWQKNVFPRSPIHYNASMPHRKYLEPYLVAAERHGGAFESLLWANPRTQAIRFAVLAQRANFNARVLLDAGCGRADLLDYLLSCGVQPLQYIGLEAVPALADAAQRKNQPALELIRGDFVERPELLQQDADVIVFSGSLNTLSAEQFYATLTAAWNSARQQVAFNFLCSPRLAAGKHLVWHAASEVTAFGRRLGAHILADDSYRNGDCTLVFGK
jgi:SAM-dependent methyltransferase